jgi:hypothetical protein
MGPLTKMFALSQPGRALKGKKHAIASAFNDFKPT